MSHVEERERKKRTTCVNTMRAKSGRDMDICIRTALDAKSSQMMRKILLYYCTGGTNDPKTDHEYNGASNAPHPGRCRRHMKPVL